MIHQALTQVLILLIASVLVITVARRLGLPAILGYLFVGMALGPLAFGLVAESDATHLLAEIGVVFLLFTLGLEFSWPRMVAMRREVFGLGLLQVSATAFVFALIGRLFGLDWPAAITVGGAVSMSSTAIVMRQLTDQAEANRSHGRLAFAVLLFQDLAFVPLLAMATALGAATAEHSGFSSDSFLRTLAFGGIALIVVVFVGRRLLRPLMLEIAHSRLRELFTLAVLFVVLASAWLTQLAGLSMALGGFLAGMMLAESEFRHQVESVIRPFRELLLGLFFISVGMLLDVRLLIDQFGYVSLLVVTMTGLKVVTTATVTRAFVDTNFKALRTGIVLAAGGEFGVALVTLLIAGDALPANISQPLLVSIVLSMVLSPFGINYNKRIARFLLRQKGPPTTAIEREEAATSRLAQREHVLLCGFGRVGQQIARVLESQGYEYIALDLDLARVRPARQAGDPVIYGDSTDTDVLESCGLKTASAVVVTFANPSVSASIVRAVRAQRADVPVLVRTQDDVGLKELIEAGATEVVPETFEASLMLVSQVLMLLKMPVSRVVRTVGEIRRGRYSTLRSVVPTDDESSGETDANSEGLGSVVLPPKSWAVGRTLDEVRARGAAVAFTALRRQGITGREPGGDTLLREGDIVVVYGLPEAIEHAEAVLLAG
ncbi:MAG: cation:proton antiporter [Steroidobacteraceae bacterium]